ncbi:MAG: protein phosphatase CheZ [Bdellovibrionales bacterium]
MTENIKERSFERDQVVQIVKSVIAKVENKDDDANAAIFAELQGLQKIIEETRQQIGAARPADISDKHIPAATDELDAVVDSTAEATGTIMDASEAIMEKAGLVDGENGEAITKEVMKIFEACSFQDITGQRITNVVKTLKTIEEKVDNMINIIGSRVHSIECSEKLPPEEDTRTEDEKLLNGPQMADKAITQDEIDKLLSDL